MLVWVRLFAFAKTRVGYSRVFCRVPWRKRPRGHVTLARKSSNSPVRGRQLFVHARYRKVKNTSSIGESSVCDGVGIALIKTIPSTNIYVVVQDESCFGETDPKSMQKVRPHAHWTRRTKRSKLGRKKPIVATELFTLQAASSAPSNKCQNGMVGSISGIINMFQKQSHSVPQIWVRRHFVWLLVVRTNPSEGENRRMCKLSLFLVPISSVASFGHLGQSFLWFPVSCLCFPGTDLSAHCNCPSLVSMHAGKSQEKEEKGARMTQNCSQRSGFIQEPGTNPGHPHCETAGKNSWGRVLTGGRVIEAALQSSLCQTPVVQNTSWFFEFPSEVRALCFCEMCRTLILKQKQKQNKKKK